MTSILFVCHANMLRSASAEYLARWLTGTDAPETNTSLAAATPPQRWSFPAVRPRSRADWDFSSAGIGVLPGHPMYDDAAAALTERGIDGSAHRARQLTGRMMQRATLTLTFDTGQRAFALREGPRSAPYILTIRRAARLLESADDPSDGAASERRGRHAGRAGLPALLVDRQPYGPPDDFADPVGSGPESVAMAVDEIEQMLRIILPALGAPLVR